MVGTIGEKEREGHIDSGIQRCLLKEVFFFQVGSFLKDEMTLVKRLRKRCDGPFHARVPLVISVRPFSHSHWLCFRSRAS